MTFMGRHFRKSLLFLLLGLVVFFAGRAIWRALASPQTKIRWRIEGMVEGFNEMRAQPVLDGVSRDFRDKSGGGTSRDDLRQILAWLFLNEIDGRNGEFLWACEFDPQGLSIALAPEQDRAHVEVALRLLRRRGGEMQPFWEANFQGSMAKEEDGWQWVELDAANHGARGRL